MLLYPRNKRNIRNIRNKRNRGGEVYSDIARNRATSRHVSIILLSN